MGAALTYAAATDIANSALEFYVKGSTHKQSIQDRPLLRHLDAGKKFIPGGKQYINTPVQGVFMDSESGFFAGYEQDDVLTFDDDNNILRCKYLWKEVHAGLQISWTDLKQDSIHITDKGRSQSSKADVVRLTGLLANRFESFSEGYWRKMNEMFWKDGSQDSKQVQGLKLLFPDDNTTGSVGGLSRATYSWWRHRVNLTLSASPANQTMTKTLRSEKRQLRRYRGKPRVMLAGSGFIEALEEEVHEKGLYTQQGFVNNGKNDIDMADIWLRGIGPIEYDPTLDDLGETNRMYTLDPKVTRLRPMEMEENKVSNPPRPYDQAMFIRSMFWTGGLECFHHNANGVYEVA